MITAKYADAGNTTVEIISNGRAMVVPADANNALYAKIVADAITIGAFVDPSPAASTDPADYPLSRFQFEGMLLAMGVTFDQIEFSISHLEMSDTEKAFAVSRLRNASSYNHGHPLIAALMPAMGLTQAEVDAAWMEAKDIH